MKKVLKSYFNLIRRFLPKEQKGSTVGLDIGTNTCKLIELMRADDSYEVMKWGFEHIQNNDVKGAVERLYSRLNISSKSPVISVSGKGTLIRYIDMPRMNLDDLKKSFAIEADKYFPFDLGTIYTDCCILDPKGKEKKMSVLVAAAKRDIIDQYVQLINSLNFEPHCITIDSVAITNAFLTLPPKDTNPHPAGAGSAKAILDMGESVSNLMILKDSIPRFNRDIFIGGQEMTKRIANVMGLSFEEAEKLKNQPDIENAKVLEICESIVMNLISEIRLSFDYFITEKNIQIDQLLLTGGGAVLKGIEEIFEKNLDVPVRIWHPVKDIKIRPDASAEEIIKQAPKFTVALGLALS